MAGGQTSSSPRSRNRKPMRSIYEINTAVWLNELADLHRQSMDLATVPASTWDSIADQHFDAVWLMGVWQRSPAGIAIANQNSALLEDFHNALPNFTPADNIGSPYCVRQYTVDPHLGGNAALAVARHELASRGIQLILDYVPNHVAPDCPWIEEHPEFFFTANNEDYAAHPSDFIRMGSHFFACGKDPNFPPWPDVVQLNITQTGVRQRAIETLTTIAAQCDGVRCDMAVLMLSDVFARTWSQTSPMSTNYWEEVISAVRIAYPNFLFIAEAYWDRESELIQQGFDFCYDKKAYDYLEAGDAASFKAHIAAPFSYQSHLLRFLENHDEPRAAAAFPPEKLRACAVATATLPGAVLFHEGQLTGRRIRVPVFLQRRPPELPDLELQAFYQHLLTASAAPAFRHGEPQLCELTGWPDNDSYLSLAAWSWHLESAFQLVVINLSERRAQGRVHFQWSNATALRCRLTDVINAVTFERGAEEIRACGLYVELEPWHFHLFDVQPSASPMALTDT